MGYRYERTRDFKEDELTLTVCVEADWEPMSECENQEVALSRLKGKHEKLAVEGDTGFDYLAICHDDDDSNRVLFVYRGKETDS